MSLRRDQESLASWDTNAESWTAAVRGGAIPSRLAGTDAAILGVVERLAPRRVLDLGCGEGWIARRLPHRVQDYLGVDACSMLVDNAREVSDSDARAKFERIDYTTLTIDHAVAKGPWDVIVCNFSLLGDPLAPLLGALRTRLGAEGRLVIQTTHPCFLDGNDYQSGWREEDFTAFDAEFPAKLPWYFRTLADWAEELASAGLSVASLAEPLHPDTQRPLSLLFECRASGG